MNGHVESQIDTLDLDWAALLLCRRELHVIQGPNYA